MARDIARHASPRERPNTMTPRRLVAVLLVVVAGLANARARAGNSDLCVVYDGKDGPGKGKHIVLVSGDEEYRSEEALPQLGKILAKHHGFKCTVLFPVDPKTGTINPNISNIPGLDTLKSADLMIIFLRFRHLPDEQMKLLVDYIESGKPIIGMRTATHAFLFDHKDKDKKVKPTSYGKYGAFYGGKEYPGGFGKQVLGETWVDHHGLHGVQSCRGIIASEAANDPIVRGIKDGDIWGPTDVYAVRLPLPGDSKPLVMGQVLQGMRATDAPVTKQVTKKKVKGEVKEFVTTPNDPMMPIAWTRTYKGEAGKAARVFTTTMGASQDLESEGLRRLLINASYWAVGMEHRIPTRSNVDIVGEYRPTRFGFNTFTKGIRPAEHRMPQ
jgi:hypothetical protein